MKSSTYISAELAGRIRRIENETLSITISPDQPPLNFDLQSLMEIFKVPGISVAVMDQFEVAWAKGYGVTEIGTENPVTSDTLFESGSISKPVAAVGALALVQEGKLSLDEDVNQKLKSWKVPENEFTREQKVTLRRILSHTAGLTVHGFPGYEVDGPVPTVVQLLNGESPANTEPVHVNRIPGTKWSYSGGGTVIAQQLMEDVTGKPFPQLMRELVFDKLKMDDSTYEQPLPLARHASAASGTEWNGTTVHGKWHVYPEMAAAGLWSTPSNLAKILIEIAVSKKGLTNHILMQSTVQEMLTPQIDSLTEAYFGNHQNPARMGLGFFLGDKTHPSLFGHSGDDAGFNAVSMMDSATGQGAVIMTNSDFGSLVAEILIDAIAREYQWKNYVLPDFSNAGVCAVLLNITRANGIQAALTQYRAIKEMKPAENALDKTTMIIFGYLLLADNRPADAVEALKQEVLDYPQYWNGYDTLAEIYAAIGEKQLAIPNYEKSVELEPDNQNAIQRLKDLRK